MAERPPRRALGNSSRIGGRLGFVETERGRWRVARNVLLDVSTRAAGIATVSAKTSALLASGLLATPSDRVAASSG